jgi:hypothetical protein
MREVVQCCQESVVDVCMEWHLDVIPGSLPSDVFECYIDINNVDPADGQEVGGSRTSTTTIEAHFANTNFRQSVVSVVPSVYTHGREPCAAEISVSVVMSLRSKIPGCKQVLYDNYGLYKCPRDLDSWSFGQVII